PPLHEPPPAKPASLVGESGRTEFTPQRWEALCKSYGQAAYAMAQARDRGVPLSAVIEVVRRSNRDAPPAVAKVFNDWYSPPYTFFLLNDDMELNRNR